MQEVEAAAEAGADGVIVQGVQAGGHVRGITAAVELLERARAALPPSFPIWLAGGVAERADAEVALASGADAVVVGTRLLLSDESDAHPAYKRRLLDASDTVLTELFGAGWPALTVSAPASRDRVARRRLRAPPRGVSSHGRGARVGVAVGRAVGRTMAPGVPANLDSLSRRGIDERPPDTRARDRARGTARRDAGARAA